MGGTMKVTAIAPWFGGKRTLAGEIVTELGPHHSYWEPFCGSAAVLFAKEPSRQETLIDLHGELTNLAAVLADEDLAVRLYSRTSRTIYSTELFRQSLEWLDRRGEAAWGSPDLEAAYHYFVCAWMGRNGCAGCTRTSFQPSIRYTTGGGSSSTRFRSAVESIPAWHERLRNAIVIWGDAFDHLPKIEDSAEVAIYADPPYIRTTRGVGGGSNYKHDFTEPEGAMPLFGVDDDHARLASELRRFKRARIVVSYYEHPRLAKLYPGWTVRKLYRQKNLHVQNRRGEGRCEAPEVLIINGPSYAMSEDDS